VVDHRTISIRERSRVTTPGEQDRLRDRDDESFLPPVGDPSDQALEHLPSGGENVIPKPEAAAKAPKREADNKGDEKTLRRRFKEGSALRADLVVDIVLDFSFLIIWGILTKAFDYVLHLIEAEWWIFWAAYFGEAAILLGIANVILRDLWELIERIWRRGGR